MSAMHKLVARLGLLLALIAQPALAQNIPPRVAVLSGGGGSVLSVLPDGFSVISAGSPHTRTPDLAPEYLPLNRSGFDSSGNATSITERVILTYQLPLPFPNRTVSDPRNRVSASEYIYSTDSGSFTNNSTLTSPQPISSFVNGPDRQTVYTSGAGANTIHLEWVAAHINARNQKEIAYASCSATDGSITTTLVAATGPAMLNSTTDLNPVIGYYCDIDVSSLAVGQITANAKNYPWIGTSGSIANTSSGTAGLRGWNPQVWTKSSTARYFAYANTSTGNDTTCVASQTAATALALPCLTYVGAVNKCKTTGSDTGNCTIRLTWGQTFVTASATTASAATAEMIIEADPAGSGTAPILQFGATNLNLNAKYVHFRNITLSRQGSFSLTPTSGGRIWLDNITYDAGSFNAVSFNASGGIYATGLTVTNQAATSLTLTAAQDIRLLRGCSNGTATGNLGIAFATTVGCNFSGAVVSVIANAVLPGNTLFAFSKWLRVTGSNGIFSFGDNTNAAAANIAFVQLIGEYCGNTSSTPGFRFSGDPPIVTSLTNVLLQYATLIGANDAGRDNIFYDNNASGVVRNHTLVGVFGSILSQPNVKSDQFVGTSGADPTDAPLHIGNWSQVFGTAWAYNLYMYPAANGVDVPDGNPTRAFSQVYAGLRTIYGTSPVNKLDPLFSTWGGPTYNGSVYSTGTCGGDYTLQPGSPALGRVAKSILPFNLAGVARPATNDSVGAY